MNSVLARGLILLAVYLLGVIPLYSLVAALEGGARGLWGLSSRDLVHQGSAFLVYAGGLLIMAGGVAIPASVWAIRRFVGGRSVRSFIAAAAIAAAAVFLGTCIFNPLILLTFPVAFLVSTGAYGLVVLRVAGTNPPGDRKGSE